MSSNDPSPRRWMRALALAEWTLAAGVLAVAFLVAQGEARGHALFHLVLGVVAISGLTAIAFRSRSRIARGGSHTFLAAALAFLALSSLLESLGGAGYDRFNDGSRIEGLTRLHAIASMLSGIALPIAAVALIVAAGAGLSRWARRRADLAG